MFPKQSPNNHTANAGPQAITTYVVGDVHGCFTELKSLLSKIEADTIHENNRGKRVVFVGDLIDRGPDSFKVVDYLSKYKPENIETIYLMGNHEEIFLKVLAGKESVLGSWLEYGGRSTARSYGVNNLGEFHINPESLMRRIQARVPESHIGFIKSFRIYYQFENYLCVHAGIKPKVPLEKQNPKDMMWIRDKFLNYKKPHSHIVVHGHTIVEEPEILSNRVAVDTGAYAGGKLTAARIENGDVKFIRS